MSAFNTVRGRCACPNCGADQEFDVQFRYGRVWQLEYAIGQQLQWNGNNVGSPGQRIVLVEGTGGPCGSCDRDAMEFDVRIEDDVVVEIIPVGVDRDDETPEGFRVVD